jgi:3-dehydroquinate dehydratase type I
MGKALIATCPPAFGTETERKALLLKAITSGARFVDIDLDSTYAFRKELTDAARKSGCKVITSYHDHERTPDRKELGRIADRCNLAGGDIVKIACMVKGPQDCARLLSLLDGGSRMVVIGMGPLGRITRVAGPLLGGEFTFASLETGKESAPGQMSRKEIEAVWKAIEGNKMGGGSA